MTSDSDIYDYDQSLFFRLLDTPKFRLKFEFVQQKQGLIVCPLELKQLEINNSKKQNDLIDTHLYLPSPFYKNHYIPLNSLISFASMSSYFSSTNDIINFNFNDSLFMLDHSPLVYLILNTDYEQQQQPELILKYKRTQICKDVKLLNVQMGYTENKKVYKILIVNKRLKFSKRDLKFQYQSKVINGNHSDIDEENNEKNEMNANESNEDPLESASDETESNVSTETKRFSIKYTYQQNSAFTQQAVFNNISDVKTFGKCVDFMHDTVCQIDCSIPDSEDEQNTRHMSIFKQGKEKIINRAIGEDLLNELELFRKTYIILPTHLTDCSKQLEKIHNKYVKKFLNSLNFNKSNSNIDLMVTIACETTINGVLFAKIWSNILKLNQELDATLGEKFSKLIYKLKLSKQDPNEFGDLCAEFFKIEKKYFLINTKSILKELKRLPLLNNPYEKLDCLKTSVDLLNNEFTISFKKKNSSDGLQLVTVTSELLIPLMAFLLLNSNINCFKSIEYFMENFQFSMSPNSYSNSHTSTVLYELSFFMITFKAALQLIENSSI